MGIHQKSKYLAHHFQHTRIDIAKFWSGDTSIKEPYYECLWHRFGRKYPKSYGIVYYSNVSGETDHIDVFDMRGSFSGNKLIGNPFPTGQYYDTEPDLIEIYKFA